MIECSILLEARDPVKNIFRSYAISACQNLFGHLVVEETDSRIGQKGKSIPYHAGNSHEAQHCIGDLLKKRQEAKQYLGVPYLLKYYWSNWDLQDFIQPFKETLPHFEALETKTKKTNSIKEIIKEGEGLFCYDEPLLFY